MVVVFKFPKIKVLLPIDGMSYKGLRTVLGFLSVLHFDVINNVYEFKLKLRGHSYPNRVTTLRSDQ